MTTTTLSLPSELDAFQDDEVKKQRFTFIPPEGIPPAEPTQKRRKVKLSTPVKFEAVKPPPMYKRRQIYQAFQDLHDANTAMEALGDLRYHVIAKASDGTEQDYVELKDGRRIRMAPETEKLVQAARHWMNTGLGDSPVFPR